MEVASKSDMTPPLIELSVNPLIPMSLYFFISWRIYLISASMPFISELDSFFLLKSLKMSSFRINLSNLSI
jgi:hypothetical protein